MEEWKEHDNKGVPKELKSNDEVIVRFASDGHETTVLLVSDIDWCHGDAVSHYRKI